MIGRGSNIKSRLNVVCRDSPLSQLQVKEAFADFPDVSYQLVLLASFGDKNKHISLMEPVAPDFFTRELDEALLCGAADIAVHSAKDLPYPLPSGLKLLALLAAFDKTDALVGKNHLTLAQLPSGARVGTSSAARKAELLGLRSDLEVVGIRGTIGERIAQVDNGYIDALIVATCALKRLNLEARISDVLPFKTHPLQGNLAIVGRADRPELGSLFASKDIRNQYGKVTLVGFGPGNPDLLTIGGDKALALADVIFHDDLLDASFLSRYKGEKIYVGKRKDIHRFHQDEINEMVYQSALSGKQAVRLKGGDPMIFAHGREEIDFLKSRFVSVTVIPGISSGIALAAYTNIPLTHRGLAASVALVTGHSENDVQMPDADTLVYYMCGAQVANIARKLVAAGRREDLPVALVYRVSLPEQKICYTSLKELQHSVIKYPTPMLMIVGEVVSFENNSTPQRVLLTGSSENDYAGAGAVTHTPLITIRPIADNRRLTASIKKINTFDWIVFTSRYGVRYFFDALAELQLDIRVLHGIRLASVGKTTTAELSKYNIYPDVEPENESAEGLILYFREIGLTGQKILLPRSDKALNDLPEALEELGNQLIDIPVYRNTVNDDAERVDLSQFQKIIFSSPSGVEAFVQLYNDIPTDIPLIAKGASTEKKLLEMSSHEGLIK